MLPGSGSATGLLPDGAVRQVEPPWAGKMPILAPLFETLVPMRYQSMAFAAAARPVGGSRHRVAAICCERYGELTWAHADFSARHEFAVDVTTRDRRPVGMTTASHWPPTWSSAGRW